MDTNAVKQATKNLSKAERRLNKANEAAKKATEKAIARAEKKSNARIEAAAEAYGVAKKAMLDAVGSK